MAVLIGALLLMGVIPGVEAASAKLQVTSAAGSPSSPFPDTTGSVNVALKNAGDATATRIKFSLISVDSGVTMNATSTQELGALGAGDSTTFTPFTYHVLPDTRPGTYVVRFGLDYYDTGGGNTLFAQISLTLTVKSPPALRIGPIAPDSVMPGTTQDYELRLRNTASNAITSVQGSWDDSNDAVLPIGASNEIFVDRLAAGGEVFVPLRLAAHASATPGISSLVFTFSYVDASGTTLTAAATLAVQIRLDAALSVALDDWDADSVTVSVSSTGLGEASAVEVRLNPGGPVDVRPAAAVFLGNLEPGDHTTATFSPAKPVASRAGEPLEVVVAYTEPDGVRSTQTFPLELGELPSVEEGAGPGLGFAVVLAVGALAAVGVYRRHGRRGV